jgi:hypothetical protein
MTDSYNEQYWKEQFAVTEADMDRLETYIMETGQAQELIALARRIVRGRLLYGPEFSPAVAETGSMPLDYSVRLWDPAAKWQIGDHVVVWTWSYVRRIDEVKIGEVIDQNAEYVFIQVEDRRNQKRQFPRAESGSDKAKKWHQTIVNAVARLRQAHDIDKEADSVILKYGEAIVSQLLNALLDDERFVQLSARWFLRNLVLPLSEVQLASLAWAMLKIIEPPSTEDLLLLLPAPVQEGDPSLFGLYLAMQSRPGIFANADPGQRPRWLLVGPPPGPATAHYAAYDPESYCVLCEPGEKIEVNTAKRLWELNLFPAICWPQG